MKSSLTKHTFVIKDWIIPIPVKSWADNVE